MLIMKETLYVRIAFNVFFNKWIKQDKEMSPKCP